MAGLDARSGVLLAVVVLTWLVLTALLLVIANLNARLRRLERQRDAPGEPPRSPHEPPYAALLGRDLGVLTGEPARVLIVLSQSCRSCRRLLTELAEPGRIDPAVPVALAWTDGRPGGSPPPGVTVLADGPGISAELGLRVTPFALVSGDDGTVAWAGPVTDLTTLTARIRPQPTVPSR